MIIWTQIANAISMVSPLICMLFHRNNNKDTNKNKNKATRLLLIHIPISFSYHFISAFNRFFHLRNILKIADLCMIHYYALRISQYFQQKRNVNVTVNNQTPLSKVSLCINSMCIVRVCQGHEDTLIRMTGLYLCSYNALKDQENLNGIITIGSISSAFFYFDEHLNNIGHSLFHILLGLLHHKILVLL
jgi:FlaA1/EpsC-like NDP-sugar epimerase